MYSLIPTIEKNYIKECLNKGIRKDNRKLSSYRNINIKKLKDNGQIMVSLGNSTVISQLYVSLVTPNEDRPNEGIVLFNVDSQNLKHNAECSSSMDALSELRSRISNLLEKSLKDSKAIDCGSLCISKKSLVWKIVVNVNLINYDGNIYDCAFLAALSSWMTYKIPFVKKLGTQIEVFSENIELINLPLLHVPICITSAIIDGKIVLDPNLEEEKLSEGLVLISSNKFNQICYMHTYNCAQLSSEEIINMVKIGRPWVMLFHERLRELQKDDVDNIYIDNQIESFKTYHNYINNDDDEDNNLIRNNVLNRNVDSNDNKFSKACGVNLFNVKINN